MHELGVTFHVVDHVVSIAHKNNIPKVDRVIIELGEVSTVVPDLLIDCWNWARKKHPELENCELKVEIVKAITFCSNCSKEYSTVEHGKICPFCGSENTYLLKGNEFNIKQIEID